MGAYRFVMMIEAYRACRVVGYSALDAVNRAQLSVPNDLGVRPSRPSRPGAVYAFVTPSMPGIVKSPTHGGRRKPYAVACAADRSLCREFFRLTVDETRAVFRVLTP